jgi:hypothetical protein
MILPESPRALVGDGALVGWVVWVATHAASGILIGLAIAISIVRLMILWRQWRTGR